MSNTFFNGQHKVTPNRLVVGLAIQILLTLHCYASPVLWARMDSPPSYIVNGKNAGTGVYERLITFYHQQLPQYDMRFIDMSQKRLWHEMTNGRNYCKADTLINAKRLKLAYFSTPIAIVSPMNIVINVKDWSDLGQPTRFSLATLMQHKNMRGAIITDRSYGPRIDSTLAKIEGMPGTNLQRKVIRPPQLYSMLALRRLNYTIDYGTLVRDFLDKNDWQSLKLIQIEEEESYYTVHVACTKNPWGQQLISDLNKTIKQHRATDNYQKYFSAYGETYADFYRRYRDELNEME